MLIIIMNMVKPKAKKTPAKVSAQPKISSFFNKETSSGLFTTVQDLRKKQLVLPLASQSIVSGKMSLKSMKKCNNSKMRTSPHSCKTLDVSDKNCSDVEIIAEVHNYKKSDVGCVKQSVLSVDKPDEDNSKRGFQKRIPRPIHTGPLSRISTMQNDHFVIKPTKISLHNGLASKLSRVKRNVLSPYKVGTKRQTDHDFGISPDWKRQEEGRNSKGCSDVRNEDVGDCKMNLMEKFGGSQVNDSISKIFNESFSGLGPAIQKSDTNSIQDFDNHVVKTNAGKQGVIESLIVDIIPDSLDLLSDDISVPFHGNDLPPEDILPVCDTSLQALKVICGQENNISAFPDFTEMLPLSNIVEQKSEHVLDMSRDMFADSLDEDQFNVSLVGDFEKMSPFKLPICAVPPKPVLTKSIKKLLNEGVGQDSFVMKGKYGRHVITSVEQNVYGREVILSLIDVQNGAVKSCMLKGFWTQSTITEGDIIHILDVTEDEDGRFTVDNNRGVLVVNPDFLISGTSVVAGVYCRRKAVLNERFRGTEGTNKAMLIGSLVHQLFQQVVVKEKLSSAELEVMVHDLLQQPWVIRDLYSINASDEEVMQEVGAYLPFIHDWTQQYLLGTSINGLVKAPKRFERKEQKQYSGKVKAVFDIEENIWSPRLGLKGKIDLTVQTAVNGVVKIMPLELKTGRSSYSAEHKGQVTLYSMMSGDRREEPNAGLLLYLKDGSMSEVIAGEMEKRGLMQLRNDIVQYLTARSVIMPDGESLRPPDLPDPLNNERSCANCGHLLSCGIYQQAVEGRTHPSSHAMASLVPAVTAHLKQCHMDFFRHWCLLLHLEMSENRRDSAVRGLWCQDSISREAAGDCISNLILSQNMKVREVERGQFLHTLELGGKSKRNKNLVTVGLQVGENVVISSEVELAISVGVLKIIGANSLEIVLDRNLCDKNGWQHRVFRIDRCEYQNTMSINFTNLLRLLANVSNSEGLRKIVIEKETPSFQSGLSRDVITMGKQILRSMNKIQQRAVLKALMADQYVLLKGYPGTGKTSTIVAFVRLLVALGHSVLLTSYTHSAVDNILLKLKACKIDFLRLGKCSRIHHDLLEFSDEKVAGNFRDVKSLAEFYARQNVVATTCLGSSHVMFSKRRFDFCIVDEASQVVQLAALGPLFHASRFVLVGDPKQLPPLVQSKDARNLGMAESLFMALEDRGATVSLTEQYRMNRCIMRLCNILTYDDQLKCASIEVETATLAYAQSKDYVQLEKNNHWLWLVVSPNLENSVVFIDTRNLAREERNGAHLLVNTREAALVQFLVKTFIQLGVEADEVGVIAPYRAQVKLIRDSLMEGAEGLHRVEVNTVDQYQGRDKRVIVYSCVRCGNASDETGQSNEILNDERRLNVAVTRARHKLVIVGDAATLHRYQPFQRLIDVLLPGETRKLSDEFNWTSLV